MKQSVHEHQEHNNHLCETHLGLCRSCDVVYCVECGKEWGAECKQQHYPYYWYVQPYTTGDPVYPPTYPPWTTTTDVDVNTTYTCAHVN